MTLSPEISDTFTILFWTLFICIVCDGIRTDHCLASTEDWAIRCRRNISQGRARLGSSTCPQAITMHRNQESRYQMTSATNLLIFTRFSRLWEIKISLQHSGLIHKIFPIHTSALNVHLRWTRSHQTFLQSRNSPLEFYLHRSQYIRLLLSSHPPDPLTAISYANENLRPFYKEHEQEFRRLLACVAYLPLPKLQNSVYRDLALPTLHFDLEPLFAKEYCASLGMSRQVPLRVVGDIGGGGALARIEKGRKVMGDRKGEWSQLDELPVRFSVFGFPFHLAD